MRRLGVAVVFVLVGACLAALPATPAQGAAATCQQLTDAQVKDNATPLTVVMQPESEVCFELPDGVGATYLAQYTTDFGFVGIFAIEDATGAEVCDWSGNEFLCLLEGQAPFRLRMRTTTWNVSLHGPELPYRIRVLRALGDTGCQPISIQPFGSRAQAAAAPDEWKLDCYSVHLPAGAAPMPTAANGTSGPSVIMFDGDGQRLCDWFVPECEPLESAVEVTMFVTGAPYVLSLYDARSMTGCRAGVDTQWGTPAVSGRIRDLAQLDCWHLPGQPGELLVLGSDAASANVLDAEGTYVCSNGNPCRLEGPPPYRLVAENPFPLWSPFSPYDYQVAARSIGPDSGCPVVAARPFGAGGTDVYPGMGCRQFDVLPGQTMHLSALDTSDDPPVNGAALIGPDGRLVEGPQDDPFWPLAPGRHTLVVDPVAADFVTMLHSVADPRGCTPMAADLTPVTGRTPFAGADCYRLDSLPGDEIHPVMLPDGSVSAPRVALVDATGSVVCQPEDYGFCTLTGVPPFRAIVGSGESTPYVLAFLDREDPLTCRPLSFGSRSGVLVRLSSETRFDCITAPDDPDDPGAIGLHVRRMAGSGGARLEHIPGSVSCESGRFSPVDSHTCHLLSDPEDPRDVLLVGDGRDQVFYVAATPRHITTIDEPGLTRFDNVTRPRLRGTPVVGARLKADPGTWAPRLPDTRFTYRWIVGGKTVRGAKGRTLTLRPAYAGKRVRVRVTADTSTMLPGEAVSKAVKLRRG